MPPLTQMRIASPPALEAWSLGVPQALASRQQEGGEMRVRLGASATNVEWGVERDSERDDRARGRHDESAPPAAAASINRLGLAPFPFGEWDVDDGAPPASAPMPELGSAPAQVPVHLPLKLRVLNRIQSEQPMTGQTLATEAVPGSRKRPRPGYDAEAAAVAAGSSISTCTMTVTAQHALDHLADLYVSMHMASPTGTAAALAKKEAELQKAQGKVEKLRYECEEMRRVQASNAAEVLTRLKCC